MLEYANAFVLAFIPLFVAIDPVGMAGMFLGLTTDISHGVRSRIAWQAPLTAGLVGLGFMVLGTSIFTALSITEADFRIAGGLILLIVATSSLLGFEKQAVPLSEDFGVVPLGLPIIAGPAMLSALLVLSDSVGVWPTIAALAANLVLVWLCFRYVRGMMRVIGKRGVKAISKLISLFLVAIAVNMIRVGWQSI